MKKFHIKILGIACLLAVLFQTSVFARNENAPGQLHKAANAEERGSGQSENQGRGNSQSAAAQDQHEATMETRILKKEEKQLEKKVKHGASELRDLLERVSSDSSQLDGNIGKVMKLKVRTASSSAQLKRHAVSGVITEVGDGVLTIAHLIHRDRVYTIFVDDLTVIAMKGKEAATFADLVVGQRIAAVGAPTDSGLLAKRIHVIPGKATGVFQKQPLATASGTLTTTPSATVAATSTPSPQLTATPSPTP